MNLKFVARLAPLALVTVAEAAAAPTQDLYEQRRLAVREIGDVSGDGISDLAIGKRWQDVGHADEGAVWIVHRQANCTLGTARRITAGEGGLRLALRPGDRFGAAVAPLGDINGDGGVDLAVGVPGLDGAGWTDSGGVALLFLDREGSVVDEHLLAATSPTIEPLLDFGSGFGTSVVSLGDLDGDLRPELGIGFDAAVVADMALVVSLGPDGRAAWTERVALDVPAAEGSLAALYLAARDADGAPLDMLTPSMASGVVGLTGSDPMADFVGDVLTGGRPLTVNFQDLSTGTGLSAWSWDFGDNHGSIQQNPAHPFYVISKFDVSLTVTGSLGTDTELKREYIVTTGGIGALRVNGNDVNPEIYESITAPDFGTLWESRINGAAIGGSGLTIIFAFSDWLEPTLTQFGELLVDVTSTVYLNNFVSIDDSLGYAAHFVPVPVDANIFGLAVFTQGFVNNLGNGDAGFTNALYVVLGQGSGG